MIELREGGLDDPCVLALLRHHLAESRASTPAANAHALDPATLDRPDITFVSAWRDGRLVGVGAVRMLGANHAELKSMRTDPAHLRQGVGRALLDHLVGLARDRGATRISLETGTAAMFAPANAMYERYGFMDGPAFGGYPPSPHNRFMMLLLGEPPCPPSS